MSQPATAERYVSIPTGDQWLEGNLAVPPEARGLVIFAHGSGSSRLSPRNRSVAAALQEHSLATLLFDLLTDRESGDRARIFDIPLLASRLRDASGWVHGNPEVGSLPQGYFGASTGAAAALVAASRDARVRAVVSRGGRPDLAGGSLGSVRAATLLIVGGDDREVAELNRIALEKLTATKSLVIIPGATHLFEEPGTLEEVSRLAGGWFTKYLRSALKQ